jgi:hypothetical protein
LGDEGVVGGRESVFEQAGRGDPFQPLAADGLRDAVGVGAEVRVQADADGRVVVFDDVEGTDRSDADRELLVQFTREALLKGFVRLALAAGEFPVAAEVAFGLALADEYVAVSP